MPETIEALVDGGKATAGPPLGPALGPLGVNIGEIIGTINAKTKAFAGMKVPIKVIVDPATKKFEIKVGTPPTSALIVKELGIAKGSGSTRVDKVGNLTMEQAMKIAEMKRDSLLGKTVKERVLEVTGTCVSMGINIEGKTAKEMQKLIRDGEYDEVLTS
ncbi:MAG: 50S ribosomal protein L11 [Methanomassiliicoccales archaeon]|nr:50S ribosomal protein L11 [Methanomassiliicoccales archaeon]NYT15104.1 50S ribosomal protein L11 [Methanomassiliicoccales archaeon]